MDDSLYEFFEEPEFGETNLAGDDLFAIFESLDGLPEFPTFTPMEETAAASTQKDGEEATRLVSQKSTSSSAQQESDTEPDPEPETSPKIKRQKLASSEETNPDGQQRMSHITVERNRRKQMNEHISVLRSLMPCFYVKRVRHFLLVSCFTKYLFKLCLFVCLKALFELLVVFKLALCTVYNNPNNIVF